MSAAAAQAKKLISPFKNDALKGKVVLISGGSSGIGYEIARQLGLHGCKLVLMGRRAEPLQAALKVLSAEGIDCHAATGDVRKLPDCERLVQETVNKYGALDVLVNNAAGNFLATADGLKPKGFHTVLEIDTMGVVNMCHAAFPQLKKSGLSKGDALVINISATLHYGATWYQAHASAAKAAIDSMTRSYGLEWGQFNIRTAGIAPGPIAGTAGLAKLGGGLGEEVIIETIPLRRMGQKFDIAMTAVFLASSGGSFISGETIVVDGASWMWRQPLAPREMIEQVSRGLEKKSRETGIPQAKL